MVVFNHRRRVQTKSSPRVNVAETLLLLGYIGTGGAQNSGGSRGGSGGRGKNWKKILT